MECTAAHLEKTFPRPYQIGLGEEHFPFKNRLSAIGFLHILGKHVVFAKARKHPK